MSPEPEQWLPLDDLMALLGPSPDLAAVDARFRRYVLEGLLRDDRGTSTESWRRCFEMGNVLWGVGDGDCSVCMVAMPPRAAADEDDRIMYLPRFRRVIWLELFSDLVPAAFGGTGTAEKAATATIVSFPRDAKRVRQETVEQWMTDWLDGLEKAGTSPTQRAAELAAQDKFGDKVTRQQVRDVLDKLRPDLKQGPRGPRKSSPK